MIESEIFCQWIYLSPVGLWEVGGRDEGAGVQTSDLRGGSNSTANRALALYMINLSSILAPQQMVCPTLLGIIHEWGARSKSWSLPCMVKTDSKARLGYGIRVILFMVHEEKGRKHLELVACLHDPGGCGYVLVPPEKSYSGESKQAPGTETSQVLSNHHLGQSTQH